MGNRKIKIFTPLLLKIFIAVNLPFVILLAGFTFLSLRSEMAAENTRSLQQGEMVLKSIHANYLNLFSDASPLSESGSQEMNAQADFLMKNFQLRLVDVLDPITQSSILSADTYTSSKNPLFRQTFAEIPASLMAKRQGRVYYSFIDAKAPAKDRSVFGYIPFTHKASRKTYVLVTVSKTSFGEVLHNTLSSLALMLILALAAGIMISLHLAHHIVKPVKMINQACREILNGNLGLEVDVRTSDELEFLAGNFNQMSRALMTMKRNAEDANPLTQLPGNQQIMAEMSRRLEAGEKFVYFHIDVDHFKSYNDRYGLGRGDDVLRWTSEILNQTLSEVGNKHNFLGHQGGDDFVLIVEPSLAEQIGKNFCKKFDMGMKNFYEEDIFKQGFFLGGDERNNSLTDNNTIKKHPLMSVSMAGISNVNTSITTCEDILEAAVLVKKKAKQIPYSKALIEELRPI